MHIVFLSSEYPLWSPGGIGTFIQTFARTLVANGHVVAVVGIGNSLKEEVLEDEGVTLIRLPKKSSKIPAFLHNRKVLNSRLKGIHAVHAIDIIEASENGLALLNSAHTAKKIIRLHGGHHFFAEAERRGINWRSGLLEKRSFSKADGFIAVSKYVKNHTEKFLSYRNRPIQIINHPIEIIGNATNISVKENHLLFAGTVCEKKGVRELLQAFQLVKEKYPNKILDLYGRDWRYEDGRSYIEQLHKDFDASYFKNVVFHGSVDRVRLFKAYSETAFCVFPSHMETQGLVTLEAMQLGKPVLFSKYGPGPETITDGETGLLCDVYNPKDIAEKMLWCIEHPKEANQLGLNAAKHVQVAYNKSSILEQNIAFYKKCMAHG